jgi:hypothetical protein
LNKILAPLIPPSTGSGGQLRQAQEDSFDKLRRTLFDRLRMTLFDRLRRTLFDRHRRTLFDRLRMTDSTSSGGHSSTGSE